MMRKALILFLALGGLMVSCADKNPGSRVQDQPLPVETWKVVPQKVSQFVKVNAEVRNNSVVDVVPEIPGKVIFLGTAPGGIVQAGDLLAEVQPEGPGAEKVKVLAPTTGMVLTVAYREGELASSHRPLVQIRRSAETRLSCQIAEKDAGLVKPGQTALVQVPALGSQNFPATVSEVAPVLNPKTGTLEVWLKLNDPAPQVKPGMKAWAPILVSEKDSGLSVPREALIHRDGATYVFTVKEDTAFLTPVTTGGEGEFQVEILGGLGPGDLIVVQGQTSLEDRSRIHIVKERPAAVGAEKGV